MSHSSIEAEYGAMSDALKEVNGCVNCSMDLVSNKVLHDSSVTEKHQFTLIRIQSSMNVPSTENDFHVVRDAVRNVLIFLHHIRTIRQVADILTRR